jgi:CubicO group peptidase (beta-lactamase class C family)
MKRSACLTACLLIFAAVVSTSANGQAVADRRDEAADQRTEYGLAMFAKLLASGVFVVGREPEEFIRNDLDHYADLGLPDWKQIAVAIDRKAKRVTLSMAGIPARTAVFCGDQGCVLLPRGETKIAFQPVRLKSALPDPTTTRWPLGDLTDNAQLPTDVDQDALRAALDFAFDDTVHAVPQKTRAMVVVYKGQIVAERYAPGFTRDMRHISWSMGKSITAALIGILVRDGHFQLDDPAPIPAWRDPVDSRSKITIGHLLHMSSGLKFDSPSNTSAMFTDGDHHRFVYFGAVDVFDYCTRRGAEFPPDTVWRYRNCDPLSLGMIIRRTVEARGENYLAFPQRALFDPIGVRRMVLEVDLHGNFIMTGFEYGTARDWARFGLLHLRDGVWEGKRILPAGWIDYATAPAPADADRKYGALFWLNRGGQFKKLPRDMYWPAGHHGQVVLIIPSREMVIVRLGHSARGGFDEYLEGVVAKILAACAARGS